VEFPACGRLSRSGIVKYCLNSFHPVAWETRLQLLGRRERVREEFLGADANPLLSHTPVRRVVVAWTIMSPAGAHTIEPYGTTTYQHHTCGVPLRG
jgi:hypothetical protein